MESIAKENRIRDLLELSAKPNRNILTEVAAALEEIAAQREQSSESTSELPEAEDSRLNKRIFYMQKAKSEFSHASTHLLWGEALRHGYTMHSALYGHTPVNLADSVGHLRRETLEIKHTLEQVRIAVSEILTRLDAVARVEHALDSLRGRLTNIDDASWAQLAEPSFAFWDNDEDAIYDAL